MDEAQEQTTEQKLQGQVQALQGQLAAGDPVFITIVVDRHTRTPHVAYSPIKQAEAVETLRLLENVLKAVADDIQGQREAVIREEAEKSAAAKYAAAQAAPAQAAAGPQEAQVVKLPKRGKVTNKKE
jgi:hypothetical protein